MRIGFFIEHIHTFIEHEICELKKCGIDLKIFGIGPLQDNYPHPGVLSKLSDSVILPNDQNNRSVQSLYSFEAVANLAKSEGLTQVHGVFGSITASYALYASKKLCLPFSFSVHSYEIFVRNINLSEKLQKATRIRTISDYNKNKLLKIQKKDVPIDVIHAGIPADKIKTLSLKEKPKLSQSFKVVSIGRLVPIKGFRTLLLAARIIAKRNPNFLLEIIGDGPDRKILNELIHTYGLKNKVTLLGAMKNKTAFQYLINADIAVLASEIEDEGNRDGIPVFLMEAMAAGLPVVSTRISGIPELVIDKKTGILVDQKNPNQLAAAIEKVWFDKSFHNQLAENAYDHVKKYFNSPNIARQLSVFFDFVENDN